MRPLLTPTQHFCWFLIATEATRGWASGQTRVCEGGVPFSTAESGEYLRGDPRPATVPRHGNQGAGCRRRGGRGRRWHRQLQNGVRRTVESVSQESPAPRPRLSTLFGVCAFFFICASACLMCLSVFQWCPCQSMKGAVTVTAQKMRLIITPPPHLEPHLPRLLPRPLPSTCPPRSPPPPPRSAAPAPTSPPPPPPPVPVCRT